MVVQPYLFFEGRAEEAIEFYKTAVGAKVEMLMRNSESPDQQMAHSVAGDKILHASITIGDSTVMLSDGFAKGQPKFEGFALALSIKSQGEADKAFAALSAGGKVTMPLSKTFFSPSFGMLHDRFGVQWMIMVSP